MNEIPEISLDHVNLPARKPEWLAEWYAENFGFKSEGGFVYGFGTLLVFEKGEPLDYQGNSHFGFRCASKESVINLAEKFEATLEGDGDYCAFKTQDPEGNVFGVYWEELGK